MERHTLESHNPICGHAILQAQIQAQHCHGTIIIVLGARSPAEEQSPRQPVLEVATHILIMWSITSQVVT